MIELGAQSTRPSDKTVLLSSEEEYQRLEPVLEYFANNNHMINFGLDCFCEKIILKILKNFKTLHLKFINDVKGQLSPACLSQLAEQNYSYITMHSLDIPANKDHIIDPHIPSIDSILKWAEHKIVFLKKLGFKDHQIILDPGIGYSKNPYQDWDIIRHIHKLKALGYPLYMGHSRKYFITTLNPSSQPYERDIETLAISNYLVDNKVDYLRVHNVADHQRFLTAKLLGEN